MKSEFLDGAGNGPRIQIFDGRLLRRPPPHVGGGCDEQRSRAAVRLGQNGRLGRRHRFQLRQAIDGHLQRTVRLHCGGGSGLFRRQSSTGRLCAAQQELASTGDSAVNRWRSLLNGRPAGAVSGAGSHSGRPDLHRSAAGQRLFRTRRPGPLDHRRSERHLGPDQTLSCALHQVNGSPSGWFKAWHVAEWAVTWISQRARSDGFQKWQIHRLPDTLQELNIEAFEAKQLFTQTEISFKKFADA